MGKRMLADRREQQGRKVEGREQENEEAGREGMEERGREERRMGGEERAKGRGVNPGKFKWLTHRGHAKIPRRDMPLQDIYNLQFHKIFSFGNPCSHTCTIGVKFGMEESTSAHQISPSSMQRVAPAGQKSSKSPHWHYTLYWCNRQQLLDQQSTVCQFNSRLFCIYTARILTAKTESQECQQTLTACTRPTYSCTSSAKMKKSACAWSTWTLSQCSSTSASWARARASDVCSSELPSIAMPFASKPVPCASSDISHRHLYHTHRQWHQQP